MVAAKAGADAGEVEKAMDGGDGAVGRRPTDREKRRHRAWQGSWWGGKRRADAGNGRAERAEPMVWRFGHGAGSKARGVGDGSEVDGKGGLGGGSKADGRAESVELD